MKTLLGGGRLAATKKIWVRPQPDPGKSALNKEPRLVAGAARADTTAAAQTHCEVAIRLQAGQFAGA